MKGNETKVPRMEDILNLPVQDPPLSEFSAAHINWIKVDGGRQGGDDIALIPFSRVGDFVKGESSSAECPANFRIESRRKRLEGTVSKPRVDGYLEYTLYWCSYGPEDYRESDPSSGDCQTNKPSSGKGSRPGRRHMMRGCLCHFTVKRLYTRPLLALIIYNQRNHVDKSGAPCHGLLDRDSIGTRAMYAPRISEELRQKIISMLYAGISVDNIIQHHVEVVEKRGGPSSRDDFLTRNDVRNMERAIRHSSFELHADDACSITMWVQRYQKCVFFFQENSEMKPFVLGIQTDWQLQQMVHYGHNSYIAYHSSFGSKKLRQVSHLARAHLKGGIDPGVSLGSKQEKYPLNTLLVFDSCQNAIPVAWIISSSSNGQYFRCCMEALVDRLRMKDRRWRTNSFLIDDPSLDIPLIRGTFQCRVFLCLWHVRRAWSKSLLKNCFSFEVQREMLRQLGRILLCTRIGLDAIDAVHEFLQIFVDQREFVEYFRMRWFAKIDRWVTAMRTLPVSNLELHAAIESYHLRFKSKVVSQSQVDNWHRVDWLVNMLTTEVHSIHWCYRYVEEFGPFRNIGVEFFSSNSWHKSLHIPDLDVILDEEEYQFAKVVSQSDRNLVYTIWNPGSEFSLCDCSWSRRGNICKHIIKVGFICRNQAAAQPSRTARIYRQALINLLENTPDDPIVLDHAILHATHMQHHLKTLKDLSTCGLLQPLSTFDTSAVNGESVRLQTTIPVERLVMSNQQGTLAPRSHVGRSQLDLFGQSSGQVNCQIPLNQMMEVQDLL